MLRLITQSKQGEEQLISLHPISRPVANAGHVLRQRPGRLFSAAIRTLLPVLLLVSGMGTAMAQAYPNKAVKLVAPFPPGGPTDVIARVVGAEIAKALGQSVFVENRPGAAGAIGADYVAKSAPDGYTICFCTTGPLVTLPLLDPKLPFVPATDLLPVSQVNRLELVLAARNNLEASTIQQLVAAAKANPGKLTYATPGTGSPNHLAMELLKMMAGIDIVPVPFKGDQPALNDLLGGHVDLFIGAVLSAAPLIKSGKIKAVAVTGAQRSRMLADTPTIAESGFPAYEASTFAGIHAPRDTPKPIIDRLHAAVAVAVAVPAIQERLASEGMVAVSSRPEAYAEYIRGESEKWAKVMKQSGIKLN